MAATRPSPDGRPSPLDLLWGKEHEMTVREIARLRFIRWLLATGRLDGWRRQE